MIVTPDMHRVHHSVAPRETNSNFGFNVPWWDLLFGISGERPAGGHTDMSIGVMVFRTPADLRLAKLLLQPFRDLEHVAGNRHQAPASTLGQKRTHA